MGEAPGAKLGLETGDGFKGAAAAAGLVGLRETGKLGWTLMMEAAAVGEGQYGGGGTA